LGATQKASLACCGPGKAFFQPQQTFNKPRVVLLNPTIRAQVFNQIMTGLYFMQVVMLSLLSIKR
jgi:hypothetical protein